LATQRHREQFLPKNKHKRLEENKTSFLGFYINFDQKVLYIERILYAYILAEVAVSPKSKWKRL